MAGKMTRYLEHADVAIENHLTPIILHKNHFPTYKTIISEETEAYLAAPLVSDCRSGLFTWLIYVIGRRARLNYCFVCEQNVYLYSQNLLFALQSLQIKQ